MAIVLAKNVVDLGVAQWSIVDLAERKLRLEVARTWDGLCTEDGEGEDKGVGEMHLGQHLEARET
jgi:hypothetical protein